MGERVVDSRIHHIRVRDGSHLRDIIYANLVLTLQNRLDDLLRPIRPIPQQPEITQRLLRAAQLILVLAEGVGEFDEQLSEAVPLVLRKGEDTGDVVVLGTFLFFGEVSDEVAAGRVALTLR